jgi:fructuronate reductase
VAGALADETCRVWLQTWWAEASRHLTLATEDYRQALLERFANPRIRHRLAQIAADGSQKLPIRILPVLRAERSAGRVPEGAVRALAAWIGHLRGAGAPVADARADALVAGPLGAAVRRILDDLDPARAADAALVASVCDTV